METFISADCHEWVFLLALLLRKFSVLNEIVRQVRFNELPFQIEHSLKKGLRDLDAWSKNEWYVYLRIFFVLQLSFVLIVDDFSLFCCCFFLVVATESSSTRSTIFNDDFVSVTNHLSSALTLLTLFFDFIFCVLVLSYFLRASFILFVFNLRAFVYVYIFYTLGCCFIPPPRLSPTRFV